MCRFSQPAESIWFCSTPKRFEQRGGRPQVNWRVLTAVVFFLVGAARAEPAIRKSVPALPAAIKPTVMCLFDKLKSTPGITGVTVYSNAKAPSEPVVAYGFKKADGTKAVTDLVISGPREGYYQYAGNFLYSADGLNNDNPVARVALAKELELKCRARPGYLDEFILTDPADRVDMGKQ
jgi:hypothetical protein